MINVTTKSLKRAGLSGLSVSFHSIDQTFPGKGNRKVVTCEVYDEQGLFVSQGRSICNPLDTFHAGIGCRKALSSALRVVSFSADERREMFAKLDTFFTGIK